MVRRPFPYIKFILTHQSLLLLIYTLLNLLFIWKYSPDYGIAAGPAMAGFVGFEIIILWTISRTNRFSKFMATKKSYLLTVILIAAVLTVLLFQFDPGLIKVGRYPAIHDWLTRLLHGEFPYQSITNPSGFPFLYIMAIPFYLAGDIGLLQIFTFLLFAGIIYSLYADYKERRLQVILLLVISPAFVYEVVVRSELFSNMVILLLYVALIERNSAVWSLGNAIIAGLVGGLVLSTRGIILPLYILFIPYLFRKKTPHFVTFTAAIGAGFLLTLVPFMIWNADYFMTRGPLAIQASYLPTGLILITLTLAAVWGFKIIAFKDYLFASAIFLFVTVLTAFLISAATAGFSKAVRGDYFDISYFCFSLPFLLLSLDIGLLLGRFSRQPSSQTQNG